MIKELVKFATYLDSKGLGAEADRLDAVIRKMAEPAGTPEDNPDPVVPELELPGGIELESPFAPEPEPDPELTLSDLCTDFQSPHGANMNPQHVEEARQQANVSIGRYNIVIGNKESRRGLNKALGQSDRRTLGDRVNELINEMFETAGKYKELPLIKENGDGASAAIAMFSSLNLPGKQELSQAWSDKMWLAHPHKNFVARAVQDWWDASVEAYCAVQNYNSLKDIDVAQNEPAASEQGATASDNNGTIKKLAALWPDKRI